MVWVEQVCNPDLLFLTPFQIARPSRQVACRFCFVDIVVVFVSVVLVLLALSAVPYYFCC